MLMPMIMGWLALAEYGREPDIDGSCHRLCYARFPGAAGPY